MTIRPQCSTDDPLAISRVYEESWKTAYRGIIPASYLDSIPAGHWVTPRSSVPTHRRQTCPGSAIYIHIAVKNRQNPHFDSNANF